MAKSKIKTAIIENKKVKRFIVGFLAIAIIAGSFLFGFLTRGLTTDGKTQSIYWLIDYIERYYSAIDEETGLPIELTVEDYANLITKGLDDYSEFYTAEEYAEIIQKSKGNQLGVGLSFSKTSNRNVVYDVIWNSPAHKQGVKNGDVVKSVFFNQTVINVDEDDGVNDTDKVFAIDAIKAVPYGEEFTLTVSRTGQASPLNFTLKKVNFLTSYVEYYDSENKAYFSSTNGEPLTLKEDVNNVLEGGIAGLPSSVAYIRLKSFNGTVGWQFKTALEYMESRGRTKLIIDLCDNGGGYMNILCDIASYLIYADQGEAVVAYAKDKNGRFTHYTASGNNFKANVERFSVIANENTASASECLIGAMGCYKRNFDWSNYVVVRNSDGGNSTYGKGIMQTTFINSATGEALKLTTANLYWPDKWTCIHGRGIKQNIVENVVSSHQLAIERAIETLN